jgi:hypothetical protein
VSAVSEQHKSNGRVSRTPDRSMRNWVLVMYGSGYVLGRLEHTTEDDVRREMSEDDRSPVVATLMPAYTINAGPHLLPTNQGLGVTYHHDIQRAEWIFQNKGAMSAWYGVLSFFSFVSEQPEAARKYLCEMVESYERATRAKESGVVLSG